MERLCTFQVSVSSTERLDRFLADQLALSRTQAARLVADGAVRVNDQPARPSRSLSRGDVLSVELPDDSSAAARPLKALDISLNVVFEDDVLLVLDKPAGLVVHPAPGHWDDTLLNALAARGTRLSAGSQGRPGILHRLDKDTSGLMILAKTDAAHRKLARALSQRRVRRVYAALVWGHPKGPLDINAAIARHPKDRKRMTVLATGRAASSRVEAVARFDTCEMVRVSLGTGRTHQIRVHLHYVGHPVVGDPTYGGGGYRRMTGSQHPGARALERAVPRQALHAAWLSFIHPEHGEACEFRAEWPQDLQQGLAVASGDARLLAREDSLESLGFFANLAEFAGARSPRRVR